jgi:hypothetical protein
VELPATKKNPKLSHLRIGEFIAFVNNNTNHKPLGLVKNRKAHKGQLLFYDTKGKVKVRPVYVFESEQTVRQSLKAQGLKLYQNGKLFYSGVIVTISKPIEHCGYTIPANQPFRLTSIDYSGGVQFELPNGIKFNKRDGMKSTSINTLVEAGLQLAKTDR